MIRFAVLALVACVALPAAADRKLADKKNCLACHAINEKVLGPSMKEIAAKYAGDAKAPDMLAGKILKGGVGAWGQVPMPANDVTADEAKTLVAWVLSLK